MATLARGLGWPCLRVLTLSPLGSPRLFTTGLCLHATTKLSPKPSSATVSKAAVPKAAVSKAAVSKAAVSKVAVSKAAAAIASKNAPPPPRAGPTLAPTQYALLKNYAARQTTTTLYEAPSHFWYYFGCWGSGSSILAWTLLTSRFLLIQPEGVPQWVTGVYGFAYMFFASMGFFIISRAYNLVHSITVLPGTPPGTPPGTKADTVGYRGASTTETKPVKLQITVRSILPFLQPKVVTTTLDKVSLLSRFSKQSLMLSDEEQLQLEHHEREKKLKQRRHDMAHPLTMPFRRMGRALKNMFDGVRSAWTNKGFGAIVANGETFKVDVKHGYALDGFRELERLVPVRSKER